MSAARWRAAGMVLLLCSQLAWSQEAEPETAGSLFGRLFGGAAKPVLHKVAGQPYAPSTQAIGMERDLLNQRASGYGLVYHEELQKYANGVLDKLKAASGVAGLPGAVYLVATDDLSAVTTADGNIFISYRWFENFNLPQYKLGQEDALAGLLAHELGHVALGHHNSDMLSNFGKWIQKLYGQGMALKVALQKQFANGNNVLPPATEANLLKMQLIIEITDRMLHPAWKRGQEEDADAFAVDVTKLAGYSYQEGVKRFLEINNSVTQLELAKDNIQLQQMQTQIDISLRDGKVDAAINGLGLQLTAHLTNILTATHPDPAARSSKLAAYVARHYKSDWYEDAEANASDGYRTAAMSKKSRELFEMYNTAFEHESLISSMKPEDLRSALALGDKMTRKLGPRSINENNWLIYYQYYRALQYSGGTTLASASPVVPAAPKKGKARARPAETPMLGMAELQTILLGNERMMSFKPYEDSINLALQKGDREQALQILAQTDKKFELVRSTLPKTIAFYVRAGRAERAQELSNYCENNYIDAREECWKAVKSK